MFLWQPLSYAHQKVNNQPHYNQNNIRLLRIKLKRNVFIEFIVQTHPEDRHFRKWKPGH